MGLWVKRLIIANVAMYGLEMFLPGVMGQLIFVGDVAYTLTHPWTIVTYMFLHDPRNIWHIAFNMLTLYFFGSRVEERLGGPTFIGLYLVSGVAGALLSFLTPGTTSVVGASGAIMGVLMAYAMYWPRERIYIYGILPVEAWLLIAFYVLWDVAGTRGIGGAGVAHYAHLGGFAAGFVFLKALELRSPTRAWKKSVVGTAAPKILGGSDDMRRWREIRLDDLHPINRAEVVRLLQKAQADGVKALTVDERATLERFAGATLQ